MNQDILNEDILIFEKEINQNNEINLIIDKYENNLKTLKHEFIILDNCTLKLNICVFNGEHEFKFILRGINSGVEFNCLHIVKNNSYKLKMHAVHENENTFSRLVSSGILYNSKNDIRGLIEISENANNSDGYEKTDVLIVKNSESISIPDLLIKNNNVKCSHGSSITRIDKEKIFYLMSRGLSEEESSKIILKGFINTKMQKINDNSFNELLNLKVSEKIDELFEE